MNRIALWSLYVFAFTIPLEFSLVIPGVSSLTRLSGMTAGVVGLIWIFLRGYIRKPDPGHLACSCFLLIALLSTTWSYDPEMTLGQCSTYAQLLLMMWIVWEIVATQRDQLTFLRSLVLGGCAAAGATIFTYLHGEAREAARYAPEGWNPNELGHLLALMIPFAWYLGTVERSRILSILHRLAVIPLLFAVLLSGSRGGVIAAAVGLLIIPALSRARRYPVVLLALAGAGIAVTALAPSNNLDRALSIRDELLTGTLTGRTTIWKAGLLSAREHPWFGVGSGTFVSAVWGEKRVLTFSSGNPLYHSVAHNTYLQILVELGLVGVAIAGIAYLIIVHRVFSMPRQEARLWAVSLLLWSIAMAGTTTDTQKITWILSALILAQAATLGPASTRTQCIGMIIPQYPLPAER
jgi:O-antigen ligase